MAHESSGVAKAGLVTGITGTVLGALNSNCGNGLLGGILGGGCGRGVAEAQYVSELQAKVQGLEAQRYSDNADKAVYQQTLADNKSLREEVFAFLTPLSQEAASNRERVAVLEAQVKCETEKAALREQIMLGKINEVAIATNGRFSAIDQTIACISGKVDMITKTVVPNSAVCPGWGDICINTKTCSTTAPSTAA